MAERLWLENYPVRWNLEYPDLFYEHIKQTTQRVAIYCSGIMVTRSLPKDAGEY